MPDFITPPPLSKGDKVAIVRSGNGPAKTEFPEVYELGLQRLEDVFGLEPVEYPTCDMDMQELSDHPEKRAQDILDAFRDDEIKGIIAAIGGSGEQIRILKHLDPDVLRDNRTRFYGYSDNTSLAFYLWNHGIVSYYGPMVMTQLAMQRQMHDYSIEYCKKAFFEDSIGKVQPANQFTDETLDWGGPENLDRQREMENNPGWRWHNATGETITGQTWGGCFEILCEQFQADKYIPDPTTLEGTVLVLETSEEVPEHYWVDWLLLALGERGLLDRFAAIIVGRPKARHHEEVPPAERESYREEQIETIEQRVDQYAPDTPVVFNIDFGHTHPIFPVPIGGKVEIDTDAKSIRFP